MKTPIAFTGGWDVMRTGDEATGDRHVVPRNDQAPHVLTRRCSCGPRIEDTALWTVVIHHAADKREHFEDLQIM